MVTDVEISGDRNILKKRAEKIRKCKDLTIEIQRKWNLKTKVIIVIIGTTGTISKSHRKYLKNVQGKHEINPLKTKRRLLYLKTQFVQRSKHFSSRL